MPSPETISEMAIENKQQIIGIAQETMKGLFSDSTEQTHTFVERAYATIFTVNYKTV